MTYTIYTVYAYSCLYQTLCIAAVVIYIAHEAGLQHIALVHSTWCQVDNTFILEALKCMILSLVFWMLFHL